MNVQLDVERGERPFAHDPRECLQPGLVLVQRGSLARVDRAMQPRAEQGRLLGLDERHAQGLAALQGGGHQCVSLGGEEHRLDHEGRRLLFKLFADQLEHAVQVRVEPHALERRGHGFRVEVREAARLQIQREVEVAHDGGHLATGESGVLVLDDALLLLALELVDMLVEPFQAAVRLQKLRGGLLADTGHAGDVVGRIALQAKVVGHLLGTDAVAIQHFRRPVYGHVGDALFRGDDARLVGSQLIGVLIAGHQQRFVAQRLVARGDGPQHVVAFPAFDAHHRHAHGLQKLLDDGKLNLQIVVHGRALRLVLLEGLHAKRRTARIERADESVGSRDVDEFQQHGQKPEDRVGGTPVGGVHGGGNRMVRAMHERVAVDDCYLLRHEYLRRRVF